MAQAEALFNLQKIDLEIIRDRKRLKEIASALEDSEVIVQAQKQVDEAQEQLKPLRADMRNLELEIQSNTDKSKQSDQRLYSGNVKNPKELQDLQNEIASLKKRNEVLEDRLLEQMMMVEEAEDTLEERTGTLETVTSEWEQEHQDLLTEKSELEADVERLFEQRNSALKNVHDDNLKLYDTMRKQKANKPISALSGRTCSICGVEQTMSTEQEVKRGAELINCSNCGRILAYI